MGLKWGAAKGASKLKCSLTSGWWEARKAAGLNNKGGRTATLMPIEGNHRRLRLVILQGEEAEAALRSLEGSCPEAVLDPGLVSSAAVRGEGGTEFVAAAAAAASVQVVVAEAVAAGVASIGMLPGRHVAQSPIAAECMILLLQGY